MLKKVLTRFLKGRILLLVALGSLVWSLTMVKSGLNYEFGLGFWGPNGHDGIWHISLIRSLARGSWQMPTFAGAQLQNYHVGFDLLLALINRLTKISVPTLYFQIVPPLLAMGIGYFCFRLVKNWTKSVSKAAWATFFVYFGGSFGWLVTLLRDGTLGGESMFWSQQAISTLINPPFALSILLMFAGLNFLLKLQKSPRTILYVLSCLLFGSLIQIKAYAGVLSLGGLLVAGIYEYFKNKKFTLLKIFIGSLVIAVAIYLPLNRASSGLLIFKPFWFLETMMGLSDRFYWPKFYEAMVNYKWGNVWLKMIPAYVVAFVIFIIGNFGTRILGVFWLRPKKLKSLQPIELLIISIIGAGILLPMLFLQAGTPWNTIQFLYYSLVFSGVLTGIWISQKKYLSILVAVLMLPTTYATLRYHYLPSRPPAKVSNQELEALNFLEDQPNGVVLTYVFDQDKAKIAEADPPRPLYFYESTAYVSAFSNKMVYMEDEVNLDITGYDWKSRRQNIADFINQTDPQKSRDFLEDNKIKYLYLVKPLNPLTGETLKIGPTQLGTEKIFDNLEVEIYQVKPSS